MVVPNPFDALKLLNSSVVSEFFRSRLKCSVAVDFDPFSRSVSSDAVKVCIKRGQ